MTLSSWKKKYYTVDAGSFVGRSDNNRTAIAAVKHSLKKWQGLRPEALKEHKMHIDEQGDLVQDNSTIHFLWISSSSCALCAKYDPGIGDCFYCPLRQYLEHRCDDGNYSNSPFVIWSDLNDPGPMIRALEGTLAMLQDSTVEQKGINHDLSL